MNWIGYLVIKISKESMKEVSDHIGELSPTSNILFLLIVIMSDSIDSFRIILIWDLVEIIGWLS